VDSSRKSSLQPSNGARARYLNGLPPDKQVEVLLKAERLGPAADDQADWLVAQAAAEAAERIAAAAKTVEQAAAATAFGPKERAALFEQLDRIESMKPAAANERAQLERIEALLRRNGTASADPAAGFFRDIIVFCLATLVWVALATLVTLWRQPAFLVETAVFALGLAAGLAYVHFAPMLGPRR
jgi:hypothetical protein